LPADENVERPVVVAPEPSPVAATAASAPTSASPVRQSKQKQAPPAQSPAQVHPAEDDRPLVSDTWLWLQSHLVNAHVVDNRYQAVVKLVKALKAQGLDVGTVDAPNWKAIYGSGLTVGQAYTLIMQGEAEPEQPPTAAEMDNVLKSPVADAEDLPF